MGQTSTGGSRRDMAVASTHSAHSAVASLRDLVCSSLSVPRSPGHKCHSLVRLLLVRHAQSANKALKSGQRASANPGLTDLGLQQAEALGTRLAKDYGPQSVKNCGGVVVVSSPMRRCLLTIQPTVRELALGPDSCICHGACFEYGCAGKAYRGTTPTEILEEFPGFSPVGFGRGGSWDYCGDNDKENEADCRARGARIVEWLRRDASLMLQSRASVNSTGTIIFCTHQTIADLLSQLLVDGSPAAWQYGDIKNPLRNASLTEIFLHPTGQATYGAVDDCSHITSMRGPRYCR